MRSKRSVIWVLLLICVLGACKGKDKNALFAEGLEYRDAGNSQGAIVLFKNALDIDPNFIEARLALAQVNLDLERFATAENEFQKIRLQDPDNLAALIGMTEIKLRTDRSRDVPEFLAAARLKHPDDPRLLNLLGRAHADQGRLQDAERIFDQVLKLDPANEPAGLNLARLQIVSKNYPAAKLYLTTILDNNANSLAARFILARLLGLEDDRQGALAQYLEISRLDPRNLEALYAAGLLALDLDDSARAADILLDIRRYFPKHPIGDRIEGLIEFRNRHFDKAAVALQNSLKDQPDFLACFFLGLSHYQLGEFEQAISQYQKGLDLNPGQVSLRINLAQALLKKGRVDDSIAELQKALHYHPDSAQAHSLLGSAYLEKGEFETAMAMLDRAAALDPHIAEVHLKKGLFNLKQGDERLGVAELEKAIDISPEVLNPRLLLAAHYLRQQNYADAIRLLKSGIKGRSEDALIYNYLAAAYLGQNNLPRAVEALKQSIQQAPSYPTPYLNLAATLIKDGDYAQAVSTYQQALEQIPGNVPILLALGSVLDLQGDEARALDLFRRAAATGEVAGISSLARFYLRNKDLAGALTVLEQAETSSDGHPALLEMKVAIQLALGREADAFETLVRWTRIDPESGATALAAHYLGKGDRQAALALADNLIADRADSGLGHWLQAKIRIRLGHLEEAQQSIADGLRREPRNLQLQVLQAGLHQRDGDFAGAERIFQQILAVQPNYVPAIFALAVQKDQLGAKAEARDLYEKTLKIDRQYIPALNNLAYLLTENYGASKEALELAGSAYRLRPASPEVMDTLGYVLMKNSRFAEAVPLLEKAWQAIPDHPSIQLHLGMAYQGLGQSEKAKSLLEKVLVAGSDAEIREARRILQVSN